MKCFYILALTILCTNQALAFDCKKASTPTEKAICANKDLVAADKELSTTYSKLLAKVPKEEKQPLQDSQLDWLKERDQECGAKADCLKDEIENRNDFLTQGMSPISGYVIKPRLISDQGTYRVKNISKKLTYNEVDVTYPELVKLADQKVMSKINSDILKNAQEFRCDNSGEYSMNFSPELINSRVFSYHGTMDYYCDRAAYPNNFDYGKSYDLKTGNSIELADVILLDEAHRPKLVALIKKQLSKDPVDQECKDVYSDDELKEMTFDFYFDTKANLVLMPSLPHVTQACEQDFTFSKSELNGLLNPNGVMAVF